MWLRAECAVPFKRMKFERPSRQVRIAIWVSLAHLVAGYQLMRGSGPRFSPLPQAPVWAMAAQIVSDSALDQAQPEPTPAAVEDVTLSPSTPAEKPSTEPAAVPVAALPARPPNEVPPALAAVAIEPKGNSGMLKVTPIALPDSPPVAFVPPPSMVGGGPAPSPSPCLDRNRVPRRANHNDGELPCAD